MEKEIVTSCTRDCPDCCGIIATVKNGKIVSHRANPSNSYTRSFLCAKGNDYLKRFYSSERLLKPMIRKNGDFEPVSWDDALDLIVEKLTQTRKEYGQLSSLWAQYSGSLSFLNLLMPRIFWIYLGGNTINTGGLSVDALQAAQNNDFGACLLHSPDDLLNSKNIIFWGKNPAVTNVHLMPFIKKAKKNGARITVVDPRYSLTTQIADRHIALAPGGDGYLAIAVAREVRRRQGKEPDSVRSLGTGWDEYTAMLDRYDDQDLFKRADVTADEVSHLASAYWDDQPAATYLGLGMNWYKQGGAHSRLIHSLIYFSGNVGVPGGGANFFGMGMPFDTKIMREEMAKAKERGVELVKPRRILNPYLAQEIEKAENPPIKLAWVSMMNPVASAPDSLHLAKVLRNLDFVIVTEQFMTATAKCADVVLPVTTYLEEDDVIASHGHPYVGPVNAAVPPQGEARSNLWIFSKVLDRMGLEGAMPVSPWEWISRSFGSLNEQGITLEDVKKGPVRRNLPDIPYQDGKFPTPDGKFQFITDYEGRPEPEAGLTLLMVKVRSFLNSQLLSEEAKSIPTVYLNPGTMGDLGVEEGERVWVQSKLDRLEALAAASDKTRPDVVEMVPCHWEDDQGGVNRLREAIASDLGPTVAFNETRVTIHKHGE
ncbi:MAG: molybdopterin-dependent oxidoreductase [Desulfobacterales bacterium]